MCLISVALHVEVAWTSSWQDRLQTAIDKSAYRGLSVTPVAIFGDGNLSNGIEDDRRKSNDRNPTEKQATMPVGVILCDGKITGSGTLLDVSAIAPKADPALVLATAAHVFFEEKSGKPFRICFFRLYSGVQQFALIDLETRVAGHSGIPQKYRNEVGEDWAFARLDKSITGIQGIAPVTRDVLDIAKLQYSYFLSAYDRWTDTIVLSRNCRIFNPDSENLANGSSKELLHDCDAIGGASGGAMLLATDDTVRPRLVGIHLGHIWSKDRYPHSEFPKGPRDQGLKPDPRVHTNYFRVFDQELMAALIRFANLKIP